MSRWLFVCPESIFLLHPHLLSKAAAITGKRPYVTTHGVRQNEQMSYCRQKHICVYVCVCVCVCICMCSHAYRQGLLSFLQEPNQGRAVFRCASFEVQLGNVIGLPTHTIAYKHTYAWSLTCSFCFPCL